MQTKNKTILISGGGTGGHIFPALAIADAIREKYPDWKIHFVGAKGRMEMQRIPTAGYSISGLWISGIQRKLTLKNLLFPFKLLSSIITSWFLIKKYKPAIVIGTGGFASGPLLLTANMLGLPTLIQEQNSFPGITNRWLGKKADVICVAYEGLEKWFPKEKIRLTGNPLRKGLDHKLPDVELARKHFGLSTDKPVLLVTGGSLGSAAINRAIAAWLRDNKGNENFQLIWQTGSYYIKVYREEFGDYGKNLWINDFIDRMDFAYSAADWVIARAGAGTISELCQAGKAVILIPSPNVAEDHQTRNARALEERNAAILLPEKKLAELPDLLQKVLTDTKKQQELAENSQKMAKPHATQAILAEIEKCINR